MMETKEAKIANSKQTNKKKIQRIGTKLTFISGIFRRNFNDKSLEMSEYRSQNCKRSK
jgi:hypothetical protein